MLGFKYKERIPGVDKGEKKKNMPPTSVKYQVGFDFFTVVFKARRQFDQCLKYTEREKM